MHHRDNGHTSKCVTGPLQGLSGIIRCSKTAFGCTSVGTTLAAAPGIEFDMYRFNDGHSLGIDIEAFMT